jgi:RNA polymerase sigma factor (sigma-70 family)
MRDASQPDLGPLSHWSNEDLVKLFQDSESGDAWAELDRRFAPWRKGRIHSLARKHGLPDSELADAQEDAVAAQLEAVRSFDPEQAPGPFGIWLNLVVTRRFLDFFWKYRRAERHLDRSQVAADALENGLASFAEWVFPAGLDQGADPVTAAELDEMWERLDGARKQLPPAQRHLLERRMAGTSYPTIAGELGVSEDQVRRALNALVAQLQQQLAEGHEQGGTNGTGERDKKDNIERKEEGGREGDVETST